MIRIKNNKIIHKSGVQQMKILPKNKKTLSLVSSFALFLVATAQATMGTTCLIFVNQPKVPQCLLKDAE